MRYDFSQGGTLSLDIMSMTGGTGGIRFLDLSLTDGITPDIGVRKNYRAKYYAAYDHGRTTQHEFYTKPWVKWPGSLSSPILKLLTSSNNCMASFS